MATHHTADEFDTNEWTAFWRENGKQVTNYTSIFKGTIRAHEWKAQYSNHIFTRQLQLAPTGTLKVHTFQAGESYEPAPCAISPDLDASDAMLKALELFGGPWGSPCGLPLVMSAP